MSLNNPCPNCKNEFETMRFKQCPYCGEKTQIGKKFKCLGCNFQTDKIYELIGHVDSRKDHGFVAKDD